MLKSVYIVGLTKCFSRAVGDNYLKTNENTPIMSTAKMFAMDSGFGDVKFMRIFVRRAVY